jgi:very-short-patch-repair endonuclease
VPHQDLESLRRLAEDQAGVVSRPQAHDAGFSDHAIRTRIASGAWGRAGRALLLHDLAFSGDLRQAWTVMFNIAESALISGPLAARLAGWPLPGTRLIVADAGHHRVGLPGVTVVRRSTLSQVPAMNGLRLAPRRDALLDTLTVCPLREAEELIDRALQLHWLDAPTFTRWVEQRSGHGKKGASRLRHIESRVSSGSRSEAEQRMASLLRRAGGHWVANYAVRDDTGRILAEIDFADPHLKIAIEVDGRAFHSDGRSFERDRERQNVISLKGWLILRFTWERLVNDPEGVIAEVAAAVMARRMA